MEAESAGRALLVFSCFDSAVPALRSVATGGYVSTLALGQDLRGVDEHGRDYDVVVVAEDLVRLHGLSIVDGLRQLSRDAQVVVGAVVDRSAPEADRTDDEAALVWGALDMDTRRRLAWWYKQPLPLTPMQFRLMEALVRARGSVVPVIDLHRAVFNQAAFDGRHRVFAHVRRVRQLLERDPSQPAFLLTVRGEGFRLALPSRASGRPERARL